MEKMILPVSPKWFSLLEKGEVKFAVFEVIPEWVKVFTDCDENEKDIMVLYNNMKDADVAVFRVPVFGSTIEMEIDYFDICSGKQLKLEGDSYFVVFLK